MSVKITVECSTCEAKEKFRGLKCLIVVWQESRIGVITHEIDDKDIVDAMRKLSKQIPRHTERSQN